MQSICMENNWAAENLQTIRTLMERSAIYRRALAPITTYVGAVGIIAALVGWRVVDGRLKTFAIYWMAISLVAIVGAFILVRRQSLKDGEVFWSPPTRRVSQAMLPPLLVGLVLTLISMVLAWNEPGESYAFELIPFWTLFYGLALHAAAAFMPRGVRLFAWGFLLVGLALAGGTAFLDRSYTNIMSPHLLMGIIFGASHLAYGIYLYFTEPRKNAA
jgi:hypothetical protein